MLIRAKLEHLINPPFTPPDLICRGVTQQREQLSTTVVSSVFVNHKAVCATDERDISEKCSNF